MLKEIVYTALQKKPLHSKKIDAIDGKKMPVFDISYDIPSKSKLMKLSFFLHQDVHFGGKYAKTSNVSMRDLLIGTCNHCPVPVVDSARGLGIDPGERFLV